MPRQKLDAHPRSPSEFEAVLILVAFMQGEIHESDALAYYEAALWGLRFIKSKKATGRRFGKEADAIWKSFRGDLTTSDRIDLLIRDADAQWPAAFGARAVFDQDGVAEDDPFGSTWAPLEPRDAEKVWRSLLKKDPPKSLRATLEAAAAAWDLKLSRVSIGEIEAQDRLLVAGPSAIARVITAFADRTDLDFCDQVMVVATPAAHRQLAAIGSALLGATKPLSVLKPGELKIRKPRKAIVSKDAEREDALAAEKHGDA